MAERKSPGAGEQPAPDNARVEAALGVVPRTKEQLLLQAVLLELRALREALQSPPAPKRAPRRRQTSAAKSEEAQ